MIAYFHALEAQLAELVNVSKIIYRLEFMSFILIHLKRARSRQFSSTEKKMSKI